MELRGPVGIAFITGLGTAVLSWAYAKYIVKQEESEKVFAKTLVAGIVAATLVLVVLQQSQPKMSLHADPFFAPIM